MNKRVNVKIRHVRDAKGRIIMTLRVVDLGSKTFGADLQHVFKQNVAKARRENRRIIGAPDVTLTKA